MCSFLISFSDDSSSRPLTRSFTNSFWSSVWIILSLSFTISLMSLLISLGGPALVIELQMFVNWTVSGSSTVPSPLFLDRSNDGVLIISPEDASMLAQEVLQAWNHERANYSTKRNLTGQCEFPRYPLPAGHLSSTDYSRCYLLNEDGAWKQCVTYTDPCRVTS